jgi:hypothetical protein
MQRTRESIFCGWCSEAVLFAGTTFFLFFALHCFEVESASWFVAYCGTVEIDVGRPIKESG